MQIRFSHEQAWNNTCASLAHSHRLTMHGNLIVAVKSAEGLPTTKKEYGECNLSNSIFCFADYSSQLTISVLVAPWLRAVVQLSFLFACAQRTVRSSSSRCCHCVRPSKVSCCTLSHLMYNRSPYAATVCAVCVCVRAAFDVGSGPLSPTRTGATAKASKKRRSKTGADVSVTGTSPTPAVPPAVASPYSESTCSAALIQRKITLACIVTLRTSAAVLLISASACC
jgi:hypothetical protein